ARKGTGVVNMGDLPSDDQEADGARKHVVFDPSTQAGTDAGPADVDMDTQEMQEASQAQTHQSSEIGDVAQDGKAVSFDDGQIE
ncbi:unnamed protein product, partial [Symbiodinium microadriaticum]